MSRSPACLHVPLASGRTARLTLCDHGVVHVNLGDLTLRLTPEQLRETAEILGRAVAALPAVGEQAARPRLLC